MTPASFQTFDHGQALEGASGMVCTSQPQAARIGLDILKAGGNAVDAAIATAAALTVAEPVMNGLGSDAFALIWFDGKLTGINGSGPAPQALSIQTLRQAGYSRMPDVGWPSITVPGAVSTWTQLWRRWGTLPFASCLQPAIDLARQGLVVTPVIARLWAREHQKFLADLPQAGYDNWAAAFTRPDTGLPPAAGDLWQHKDQATTLEELARTEGESFYRGDLADVIDQTSRQSGGLLRRSDLAAYQAQWVDAISVPYKGYRVYELPPNGQGLVALMALQILSAFESEATDTAQEIHRSIEALKLAFTDGRQHITDPDHMAVTVPDLLDPAYAASRSRQIGDQACQPQPGRLRAGGTVYLCTADRHGTMVSFIQSNYTGFGSGAVVPATGIAFNNRGKDFSFDPAAANVLLPGKKPYHTIIPGFLFQAGRPVGPFGVMGGLMQPQGHVQVLVRQIDQGLDPQQALDAPRWRWDGGRTIRLEPSFPKELARDLARRGHQVNHEADYLDFGRGQIIRRKPGGGYTGGSDARADGCCVAY